jgi:hypothetical protein
MIRRYQLCSHGHSVAHIPLVEELREEVEVGHEGGLQDDGHVRRVEQLDRVRPLLPAVPAQPIAQEPTGKVNTTVETVGI